LQESSETKSFYHTRYKTKLIAESKKKTDKVDAKVLADLARSNFLPTAYLPERKIPLACFQPPAF